MASTVTYIHSYVVYTMASKLIVVLLPSYCSTVDWSLELISKGYLTYLVIVLWLLTLHLFYSKLFLTGKLLSRSLKIAHALLNKTFTSKTSSGGPLTGDSSIKPGDRVALVYPNNDPINFMCAFYGCLQAGIVPVPIEVPLTRRDAGLQQVGFLLGSCGIQYALTSDNCLKGKS